MNKILNGDSLEILKSIDKNSIDVVVTDPPYFLDKLDNNWENDIVESKKYQQTVTSLPAGMKFDKSQGKRFYDWYFQVSRELNRVLKPGGYFFSFSSPRLYHRMSCAIEDANFNIRDMFIWLYTQNQPKKIDCSNEEKNKLSSELKGWKTPQIKSCFEPICVGQKNTEGTFLNNMTKYKVGLVNTNLKIGKNCEMFVANTASYEEINETIDKYFLVSKPTKKEKGHFNIHKTVKPLEICKYLISLTTFDENSTVLDPFAGSGTTLVAAKQLNRKFIGIELNKEYVEIINKRLELSNM